MRIGLALRRRTVAALVIGSLLALGVAACGSSSSSSSTSTSLAGSGSGGTSTTSAAGRYQARLNFAKCMRAHGVNVPDPSANGGPAGGGGGLGLRSLRSSPNFQSANQACAKYRSQAFAFGNVSPQQRAQFQRDLVKFAECMRAHNIDIPDPSTSGGGGFGIFRQIPSSERNSPAFQSALKACSSNIPFRRGAGPGGAPSGNTTGA